ncbi:limonene-1,2-epoxide hydrolase family protein [Mycolicibacterium confluentis]|uniref:Limonene-1,2-epoxide hydrolase n=1 Tax=Mycolicibacterium confluentis TaxID=28047 RepID=A0A7I7XXV1_9MYCO|nr:limonene-1,2-epoxide hydrolase family protein [Mycolicibacterium confluentis]MCV7317748.1 nuclear transport factor 2 family protein [Mycolicibacterium confluentis]ORV28188.1 limonene-1,2-epoxide hydrolase [Mycolicibacterium confluentis]BBZ34205.1 limonene-1,2-epoxide hydrolase [Mycolicibacterium confluentis]
MTEQSTELSTDTDIAVVEKFLFALRDKDLDTAGSLLDDDVVYQNVGFPIIRGRARTIKIFKGMDRDSFGFDVKFHRSVAEGGSVLNERTDALSVGRVRMQFWVCGVFEVRDGRITLWRDYFDLFAIAKGVVRGLLGAVLPGLRPHF